MYQLTRANSSPNDIFIAVTFKPSDLRESSAYWPKLLTTSLSISLLSSVSGYFENLLYDNPLIPPALHIKAQLSLYESLRIIFKAIHTHGTSMPSSFDLSRFTFTEFALLLSAATMLQIPVLQDRILQRLENMKIQDTEITTLLASVPLRDPAVRILINNITRVYLTALRRGESQVMRGIDEMMTRHDRRLQQWFKDQLRNRSARYCECEEYYCCGWDDCCVHVSTTRVVEERYLREAYHSPERSPGRGAHVEEHGTEANGIADGDDPGSEYDEMSDLDDSDASQERRRPRRRTWTQEWARSPPTARARLSSQDSDRNNWSRDRDNSRTPSERNAYTPGEPRRPHRPRNRNRLRSHDRRRRSSSVDNTYANMPFSPLTPNFPDREDLPGAGDDEARFDRDVSPAYQHRGRDRDTSSAATPSVFDTSSNTPSSNTNSLPSYHSGNRPPNYLFTERGGDARPEGARTRLALVDRPILRFPPHRHEAQRAPRRRYRDDDRNTEGERARNGERRRDGAREREQHDRRRRDNKTTTREYSHSWNWALKWKWSCYVAMYRGEEEFRAHHGDRGRGQGRDRGGAEGRDRGRGNGNGNGNGNMRVKKSFDIDELPGGLFCLFL